MKEKPVRGDYRDSPSEQKAFIFKGRAFSFVQKLAPYCMNESRTCGKSGKLLPSENRALFTEAT